MVGKKVVFAANLAPARIFGIESHGMVLAAESKETVSLLTIDKDVPVGSGIR
jgi:methionyl-tRNA synthetase